ncbi:DUF397 domain-containing protein [Actinocatenispora comari]|uniref:DUF397 domain-containing protein n=1 Tax=Actinocatenispora comari TaxID=2807577 RepID=A0A8J4A6T9_9ACTN|nr:DUF397 domain-containing protein [Actinocatenispora comari]GIL26111.1 hypothetical protein NUM_13650 [Actinocatenispora comari]
MNDICHLRWWKSSRSGNQGGQCVEIATSGDTWYVRDSKDARGGRLAVDRAAWQSFVRSVKTGTW